MSEREERLVDFIDNRILEYEIEYLECFANNDLQRAGDISPNMYTLSTLKELLKTKIELSAKIEQVKHEATIQDILLSVQISIQKILHQLNDGIIVLDEDILHIARNNFEMLYEYFTYLTVE